jgi:metal-responsive CopG/Arc/MetJ family transcriptional regulator
MSTRLSFTLESELAEQIERFAQEKRIDRNEAILRLIEAGFVKYTEDGSFLPVQQERGFEEVKVMKRSIDDLTKIVLDLKKEVRVVHHILDFEWQKEPCKPPHSTRRWWEFWKG